MKRFTGIVLLMLMGYNLIGYFPAFYTMQQHVKHEMRSALRLRHNRKELTTLSFTLQNGKVNDADFEQLEEDEFRYKGEMYDVVRTEKAGSTITFYVLQDKKESRLFANLHQFIKQNSAENPFQKSSKLFNSFCKLEFISSEKLTSVLHSTTIQSIFLPYHIWRSDKHITPIYSPPESLG